MDSISMT